MYMKVGKRSLEDSCFLVDRAHLLQLKHQLGSIKFLHSPVEKLK